MRINVSEKIVESLITIGVVPSEDKDLYQFGLDQGVFLIINALSTILIGLILGMLWQSIVFMLSYIPIRSYAGGYHASTQLKCYLLSIVFILAVLMGIKLIPWNGYICSVISLCAAIFIFWLAPVEDRNKPLRQIEVIVYKRRTRILFVLLLSLAFLFVGSEQTSISIIMALQLVSVMLILGVMKNSRDRTGRC